MRGLCKLIANVAKEWGEKQEPWQQEPRGPHVGLLEKPLPTLRGRVRSNWEKTRGEAEESAGEKGRLEPTDPPATGSRLLYRTWFAIFGRAKVACQSLVLQLCPPPQALGSSSSCSLMLYWEHYVFLLNITFPRDRGGQPVIRKPLSSPAFLLMLLYLHRNGP